MGDRHDVTVGYIVQYHVGDRFSPSFLFHLSVVLEADPSKQEVA